MHSAYPDPDIAPGVMVPIETKAEHVIYFRKPFGKIVVRLEPEVELSINFNSRSTYLYFIL